MTVVAEGAGTLPEPQPLSAPVEGQVWSDGINAGCFWQVAHVEGGKVVIVLWRGGESTRSFLDWPVNRWGALVGKQLLSLVRDPDDLRAALGGGE